MKLIIAEKNDAARQIAERLSTGKPKKDKVYNTAIYRFEWKGEECVTIGLAGHILAPDFCDSVLFDKKLGWYSVTEDGEMLPADMPDGLARPPYDTKRKPFLADGISIKGWKLESLPYLTWAPVIKLPAEKELIRSLKNLAKKSDSVIIATDFDREGELIGSDALNKVREVAPDLPVARAQYSSFTKAEITQAFDNLVSLDQNLADAGESRQHIDLIWGAVLTRYLTLAKFGGFGNVRSAGRVQTPTLALVVERERERMAFVPEDYWQIRGMGAAQGAAEDDRFKIAHKTARFTDKDAAETAYGHVDGAMTATVAAVTKRSRKQQPPTPFATTSLQAAAAAEGISPARTMRIAESLYMAGLISYPRVDNTVYPATLDLGAVVSDLAKINPALAPVCKKVLAGPMKPTRGKVETTDHPPIYPTGEGDPSTLDGGQRKLYDLIARRFLATLMGPAIIENTKLELDVNGEPFVASGDVLVTPGFREAYPYGLKRDEQMPPLEQGDTVDVFDIKLEAKQTEPPARYSQGKLVQEMEKRGLGTKSTRASIIERLYAVRYLKNDPVEPSQLGIAIIDALTQFAPRITSPDMTSELDGDMTRVERGEDTEEHVVTHSRALLAGVLDELLKHTQELGDAISDAVTADARVGACPKCGKEIRQQSIDQIIDQLMALGEGTRVQIMAPVIRGKKGEHAKIFEDARKSGYVRVRVDGNLYDLSETIELDKNKKHRIEIIVDRLLREFKVEANVGAPQVAYRETIRKEANQETKYARQSGGKGQYGHVKIKIEPNEPGKGYEFVNAIVGGAIPKEYIPAIDNGIQGAMKSGVLAGYPVVDVKVTLWDGSYHEVDSSEMAFSIAGSMAFKDAMRKADPIITEPIMKVAVIVPDEYLGDVIGDLNARRGQIQGMEAMAGTQRVNAFVPLAQMFGYATDLRSKTQGRGQYVMEPSHYEPVPKNIADQIIAGRTKG